MPQPNITAQPRRLHPLQRQPHRPGPHPRAHQPHPIAHRRDQPLAAESQGPFRGDSSPLPQHLTENHEYFGGGGEWDEEEAGGDAGDAAQGCGQASGGADEGQAGHSGDTGGVGRDGGGVRCQSRAGAGYPGDYIQEPAIRTHIDQRPPQREVPTRPFLSLLLQFNKMLSNTSIIYSKAQFQYPIKNAHHVTCMAIDLHNNVYLAIGSSIQIYSLRRLSRGKDYLIAVVDVNEMERTKHMDEITRCFNEEDIRGAVSGLIQSGKLMQSSGLCQRATFLNSSNPKIQTISVSPNPSTHLPNLCLTLSDNSALILTPQPSPQPKPTYKICLSLQCRTACYVSDCNLALVSDSKLTVTCDTSTKPLYECEVEAGALRVAGAKVEKEEMIAILYPKFMRVIKGKRDYRVPLGEFCDYVQVNTDGTVDVASNTKYYRLGYELEVRESFHEQRVLRIKDGLVYGDEGGRVKCMQFTRNNLMVWCTLAPNNFKECDLMISTFPMLSLLQTCLKSLTHPPCCFSDVALLSGYAPNLFTELFELTLSLYDSKLISKIKNPTERKISVVNAQAAIAMIERAGMKEDMNDLVGKMLVSLLAMAGADYTDMFEKVVKERTGYTDNIWTKCMQTGKPLGKHDLQQCKQCRLYRIANTSADNICRVCCGQITPI